ncbi:hypothetical protein CTEN210_07730 [Chaetoceros tenuissimus]|uniref:Uncharacterized protein n=1 Tax=Chaetoceros tenuissimus TaxID=426638 RepID=A0AAD3CVC5_9STRA|nr:hypothetical protein CTEN210_07730 [Chaetoceros tenuissimus]
MTSEAEIPKSTSMVDKGESFRRHDGTLSIKRPNWKKINSIEEKRREILKRVEKPAWRILFYRSGTCLKGLALDPLIYITLAVYIGIRVYARLSKDEPADLEIWGKSNIAVLGGFLSFFLVLFVNQTNTRFLEMYGFSKAASGRTQDVAGMASTQFPQELAENIIRHMNAAHVAGYCGLGGPYSKKHFFDHYNKEWNMLTEKEMDQLAHYDWNDGSDVLKELCTWCQRDVGLAKKLGHIDSMEAVELHTRIVAFRAAMDGIYDYCDQPPHFFYIHFLCLLSAFYLPIFAIDNGFKGGWGAYSSIGIEILNGIIVLLQCIFVIGLRLIGQKMADPYGDDHEDLSVKTYVETTLHICRIIFTTEGSLLNKLLNIRIAVERPRPSIRLLHCAWQEPFMMKSNFLLLSLISVQSSLAYAFSLVHTRKAAINTQRISYKLKSKQHSYQVPNYVQDSFRLLMTAGDDDGWGDDAKLSTSPSSSQEDELESLRAQVSSKTKNDKQNQIAGDDNTERDLFIPIFAIVSLVGLFGAYGYEMLRLYSRGELYLPWN